MVHEDERHRTASPSAGGMRRVFMQSAGGRQVTVRYARANDVLGVAAAVAGPAPVAGQALVDSHLLAFDPAAVAWAIAEELGRRLYVSLDQLAVNAFGSVRERVARHLLDAATPGKQEHPTVDVTQQELADAVGSAREVIARVVRQSMFAMDHAATALVLKRRYPRVPMAALLASVQLPELVWVFLNVFGIERTTTEARVHTVADIHLAYMPYSHSVTTVVGAALLAAGVLFAVTRRRDLAVAVGLGMASHLVLDLITHAPDLMLAPGVPAPRLGLGLYPAAPWAAFLLELAYGVACWRIYRGTYALLATVLLFNAANVSMFST